MDRPGELRTVAALALVAAALRAATALGLGQMMNDGPTFLALAREMSAGAWGAALIHDYHPLYPMATAAAQALVRDWTAAALLVSVLAGTGAVVVFFVFLRDAFGRRTAWIGAGLLAIHPYAVDVSGDVQSDGLYHALFLAAVALAWLALSRERARFAFAAGAVSGLAYLTRPEGVGVVLVTAAVAALRALGGAWPPRRAAACVAALALGWACLAAPYLLALRELHGEWTLTRKKSVASVARLDDSPVAAQPGSAADPRSPESSLTPVVARVGPVAAAVAEVAGTALGALRYDFLLLLAVGAWSVRGPPGLRGLFLGAMVGAYVLVVFGLQLGSGYSSKRHLLPPLSLLLGYAALGAPLVGGFLAARLRPLASRALAHRAAPLALVALLLLAWNLPRDLAPRRADELAVRRAAEWLRDVGVGPGAVATTRSRVAFYADAAYVPLRAAPGADGEAVVAYLRAEGVAYVIVDDRDLERHPAWRDAAEDLPVLHEVSARGRTARVYGVPPTVGAEASAPGGA